MSQLEEQIVQSLRRIVRAIDVHSRKLSREFELTWPQLAALHELQRLGRCPVGKLADEMFVGAPTVTGIVDRLERDGLVQREREPEDRRKVLVALTPAGENLLARKPSLLNEQLRSGLAQLSERRQREMRTTLDRLAEMMEAPEEASSDSRQP